MGSRSADDISTLINARANGASRQRVPYLEFIMSKMDDGKGKVNYWKGQSKTVPLSSHTKRNEANFALQKARTMFHRMRHVDLSVMDVPLPILELILPA